MEKVTRQAVWSMRKPVRSWRACVLLAVSVGLCSPAYPEADFFDGTVYTSCGAVQGSALPHTPGVWAFRGLRYAAPPIGSLRWKPPESPACSPRSRIIASHNGQVCTQKNPIVTIYGKRYGFTNPLVLVQRLSYFFFLCSIALFGCGYLVCKCGSEPHKEYLKLKFIEDSGTDRLLHGAIQPVRSSRLPRIKQLLCFMAWLALVVSVMLLYFSHSHRIYLGSVLGGEDCLFLNIYAHQRTLASDSAPVPVMFFVHGGDLTIGAGADIGPGALYGGSWALAAEGRAIAVQINYRLNVFGFLYLEDLNGTSVFGNSTNLGILDQMAALRWVRDHIAEFGGNPNLVTIYGQSSGGTSISALLTSPLARGLFHRAFSMSASPRIDATPKQAAAAWRRYLLPLIPECLNKWHFNELRECLFSMPAERLVLAMPAKFSDPDWMNGLPLTKSGSGDPVIYLIVADGHVIPSNVSEVLSEGDPTLPAVPTVFGNVREECDLDLKEVRAQNMFDNAAWPLTQTQVMQWGVQLTGEMEFGKRVWNLYKPNITQGEDVPSDPDASTSPVRQRWSQLTSDIRMICGNIYNAKQLAQGQSAPVYSYLFTHRPQAPVYSHLNGWPRWVCQDSSQYAFHMWDIILLFNRTAGFHNTDPGLQYVFTPLDFAVADRFRAAVLEFAETGRISWWTAMEPNKYSVCHIDLHVKCDGLLKKEECDLFERYGVSYANWIVN